MAKTLHISVPNDVHDEFEKLRVEDRGAIKVSRKVSDFGTEILQFGLWMYAVKKRMSSDEFDKVLFILRKVKLENVDVERFIK